MKKCALINKVRLTTQVYGIVVRAGKDSLPRSVHPSPPKSGKWQGQIQIFPTEGEFYCQCVHRSTKVHLVKVGEGCDSFSPLNITNYFVTLGACARVTVVILCVCLLPS